MKKITIYFIHNFLVLLLTPFLSTTITPRKSIFAHYDHRPKNQTLLLPANGMLVSYWLTNSYYRQSGSWVQLNSGGGYWR
jgi:hypothetical protein